MNNFNDSVGGINVCITECTVSEGTNSATVQIAEAIDVLIDGRFYEKAITDNIAITDCDGAVQADNTTCLYLLGMNAAGTVTTYKGREILTADLSAGNDVLEWPIVPGTDCVIGGFRIVTADGYTYTPGTTDNGATGITDTYYQILAQPVKPMTS